MQLRRTNLPGQLLLVLLEAYVHGRLSTGDRGSAQLSSAQHCRRGRQNRRFADSHVSIGAVFDPLQQRSICISETAATHSLSGYSRSKALALMLLGEMSETLGPEVLRDNRRTQVLRRNDSGHSSGILVGASATSRRTSLPRRHARHVRASFPCTAAATREGVVAKE
jgi:hypothetical protein